MSDFTDPNRASNLPLVPGTPRRHKLGLGFLVMATVALIVAAGAWYLKYRTPPSDNGSPGMFHLP